MAAKYQKYRYCRYFVFDIDIRYFFNIATACFEIGTCLDYTCFFCAKNLLPQARLVISLEILCEKHFLLKC